MASSTPLFGDKALTLITDARRSTASNTLYPYADPMVRSVCAELRALQTLLEEVTAPYSFDGMGDEVPEDVMATSMIYHLSIRRNKQCLLAYHAHRLQSLRELYWSSGGSLPHILNNPAIRAKLSPHEVDFLRSYNDVVKEYRADFGDVLDVLSGITEPPKELQVLVRVMKECGAIHTELGTVDFQRGQRYMVRRSDVEHLISQGFLQVVG